MSQLLVTLAATHIAVLLTKLYVAPVVHTTLQVATLLSTPSRVSSTRHVLTHTASHVGATYIRVYVREAPEHTTNLSK